MTELNGTERNIMTIEDPVEYVVPSINQIQINEHAGVTFAGGLRAILRQDPDIILVGEIRDGETARIAVQAALTGHFVLSSLHATDSTSALLRFLDMGIEPYIVASAVAGVLSQRLVRRICDQCRGRTCRPPTSWSSSSRPAAGLPEDGFWHGEGCTSAPRPGYQDRIGVYELLRMTPAMRALVATGRHTTSRPGPGARRGHPHPAPGGRPSRRGRRHHHRRGRPRHLRPLGMDRHDDSPSSAPTRSAPPREVMPARVKGKDLMHLSRQLAAFMRAGIPILDGLTLLGRGRVEPDPAPDPRDVAEGLRQGEPLAEAFDRHPEGLPAAYRSMIRSAELTGNLDAVLDRLTVYLEREVEARSKIRSR